MEGDTNALVRKYAAGLSNDDLRFLNFRLGDGFSDGFCEALAFLESDDEINEMLGAAEGSGPFNEAVDRVHQAVAAELRRRQKRH